MIVLQKSNNFVIVQSPQDRECISRQTGMVAFMAFASLPVSPTALPKKCLFDTDGNVQGLVLQSAGKKKLEPGALLASHQDPDDWDPSQDNGAVPGWNTGRLHFHILQRSNYPQSSAQKGGI